MSVGTTEGLEALAQTAAFCAPEALPMRRHRLAFLHAIERHAVVIVTGPTGCGKSTQIPRLLAEQHWPGVMVCTQPRRLAATGMAERVAAEMGCAPAGSGAVGYAVRLDQRLHPTATRIKYCTDGLLFQETLADPLLARYAVVMLDEAHERTVATDLLLAWLRKILPLRPTLRVVISSATIDVAAFQRFFTYDAPSAVAGAELLASPSADPLRTVPPAQCPAVPAVVSVQGRQFPIAQHFLQEPEDQPFPRLYFNNDAEYLDAVVHMIGRVHRDEAPGDVLVFLAGRQEIGAVLDALAQQDAEAAPAASADTPLALFRRKRQRPDALLRMDAMALHAGQTPSEQARVFERARPGWRKVVLATNVAEASVTIEGIAHVIDGGRERVRWFDAQQRCSHLRTLPTSQASALQRAGRAGRTQPGRSFRLYSARFHQTRMAPQPTAAISRADWGPILLQLLARGVPHVADLQWLTPPPRAAVLAAVGALLQLGALRLAIQQDRRWGATALGALMGQLPLDPALARFVVEAARRHCGPEAAAVAAMAAAGCDASAGVLDQYFLPGAASQQRRFYAEEGDHVTLLNLLANYAQAQRRGAAHGFAQKHGLRAAALDTACRLLRRIVAHARALGLALGAAGALPRPELTVALRKCLLIAYPGNAAVANAAAANYAPLDAQLPALSVHPSSVLFTRLPRLVLFGSVLHTTRPFMQLVSVVDDAAWLVEALPARYRAGMKRT